MNTHVATIARPKNEEDADGNTDKRGGGAGVGAKVSLTEDGNCVEKQLIAYQS